VRVSASRLARISSKLTSGSVDALLSVSPSFSSGPLSGVPGSSSTIMSFSPVLGRSSSVASGRTRAKRRSMSSVSTAAPSSSRTPAISPTRTPEIVTAWPCPGSTPAALVKRASMRKWSLPITGIQLGPVRFWLARMKSDTAAARTTSTAIITTARMRSRSGPLIAHPSRT
jgi:hypothetical protein